MRIKIVQEGTLFHIETKPLFGKYSRFEKHNYLTFSDVAVYAQKLKREKFSLFKPKVVYENRTNKELNDLLRIATKKGKNGKKKR